VHPFCPYRALWTVFGTFLFPGCKARVNHPHNHPKALYGRHIVSTSRLHEMYEGVPGGLQVARFMFIATLTATGPASPMRLEPLDVPDNSHEGPWNLG
jgi:hypothetical protein